MINYRLFLIAQILTTTFLIILSVSAYGFPPKERVIQAIGTTDGQKGHEDEKPKTPDPDAVQTLINKEIEIEQRSNKITEEQNRENQQNIDIQRNLVKYTGWLIAVGIIQAVAFFLTLLGIKDQSSIPFRARLKMGEPQKGIGNEIIFPVENYGQVDAVVRKTEIQVQILDQHSGPILSEKRQDRGNFRISPGKENQTSLSIIPPASADFSNAFLQILFSGTIYYRIGFGWRTDKLQFIKIYLHKKNKWLGAYFGWNIDFTKRS